VSLQRSANDSAVGFSAAANILPRIAGFTVMLPLYAEEPDTNTINKNALQALFD
jgi:hypothetical protein